MTRTARTDHLEGVRVVDGAEPVGDAAGVVARVRLLQVVQLEDPVGPQGVDHRLQGQVVLEPRDVGPGVAARPALEADRAAHRPHDVALLHLLVVRELGRSYNNIYCTSLVLLYNLLILLILFYFHSFNSVSMKTLYLWATLFYFISIHLTVCL